MAIIATPSIFVDKLLYETKIQIKASVFTAGVIVLLVALVRSGAPVPVLALMLLFFIPIAIVTPTVAYKLGTLHSMLKFMGLTRDFDNEGMVSEVIKTSFVQIPGYAILTAIIGGVLYLNFGLDYFLVLFQDPEAFFDAESLNLLEGKVQHSSLLTYCILFFCLC